jgi:hypothetical protein
VAACSSMTLVRLEALGREEQQTDKLKVTARAKKVSRSQLRSQLSITQDQFQGSNKILEKSTAI